MKKEDKAKIEEKLKYAKYSEPKMDLSMSDEFINSYINIRRTYRFLKILSNQTIDNSAK